MDYILIYAGLINIITFALYGLDKWKAIHGKWRISEMTLLLAALAGGAAGAFRGMRVFRHKTKHWKFRILVPLFLALEILAFGYLLLLY